MHAVVRKDWYTCNFANASLTSSLFTFGRRPTGILVIPVVVVVVWEKELREIPYDFPQFLNLRNTQIKFRGMERKFFLRHKRIPFDFQAELLLSAVSREIPFPDISIVIAQSTAATSQKKITSSVSKSVVACAMLWIGRSQSFFLLSSLEVVWGSKGKGDLRGLAQKESFRE